MTYQEANALVDDFSFVYKGKSISKEVLIECREVIHKALEKQIPKKPVEKQIIGVSLTGYKYKGQCPRCSISVWNDKNNYCHNCGQALGWNDLKGETK